MSKSKKKPTVIKNIQEAEQAVKRIHQIQMDKEYWDQCEERAIQKVRDKFDAKRKEGDEAGMIAEEKELTIALETYCKADKKNWDGKKSLKTRYGVLSFHAGQPAVKLIKSIAKNFDVALKRLRAISWGATYIRLVEEINKDEILDCRRDWDEKGRVEYFNEEFKQVGLKVVQQETFKIVTDAKKQIRERLESRP